MTGTVVASGDTDEVTVRIDATNTDTGCLEVKARVAQWFWVKGGGTIFTPPVDSTVLLHLIGARYYAFGTVVDAQLCQDDAELDGPEVDTYYHVSGSRIFSDPKNKQTIISSPDGKTSVCLNKDGISIATSGNVSIDAPKGNVIVAAKGDMTLASQTGINLTAAQKVVFASKGNNTVNAPMVKSAGPLCPGSSLPGAEALTFGSSSSDTADDTSQSGEPSNDAKDNKDSSKPGGDAATSSAGNTDDGGASNSNTTGGSGSSKGQAGPEVAKPGGAMALFAASMALTIGKPFVLRAVAGGKVPVNARLIDNRGAVVAQSPVSVDADGVVTTELDTAKLSGDSATIEMVGSDGEVILGQQIPVGGGSVGTVSPSSSLIDPSKPFDMRGAASAAIDGDGRRAMENIVGGDAMRAARGDVDANDVGLGGVAAAGRRAANADREVASEVNQAADSARRQAEDAAGVTDAREARAEANRQAAGARQEYNKAEDAVTDPGGLRTSAEAHERDAQNKVREGERMADPDNMDAVREAEAKKRAAEAAARDPENKANRSEADARYAVEDAADDAQGGDARVAAENEARSQVGNARSEVSDVEYDLDNPDRVAKDHLKDQIDD